jgi:autotransporter-associated beta strand protein
MSKNYSKLNMISEKNHRGLFAFILAALISTTSYNAQAAVFLWNNTGTQWTSGTSWVGGAQPAATSSSTTTDEVQFGNVGANFNAVDMTSTRAAKNFTFLTGANAYTVGTSSAKLLEINGGLTNNSTATQTFNLVVNNANNSNTWTQVAGGALVFNNTVNLTTGTSSTSRTLTLAGAGSFTFNSSLNNGGTATGGKVVVNAAGGTVNLNAANNLGGGFTVTAGTVNFNNAAALGTGTLELGNTAGALYGNSVLNNATGSAVTLGNSAVVWAGTAATGVGVQIGTAASTSANNINFGSGLVTASTSRNMNIAGTGVTLSMGTLNSTTTDSGSVTFTVNGVGNTLVFGGYNIRANAPTSLDNRIDDLAGTANLTITGEIANGNIYSNGLRVRGTGVTTFSGNNTYDGLTTMQGVGGTLTLSGNNSGAAGGVTLTAGTLNINNANALGTGIFRFGGSTIDNTSGSAVVNAGNQEMFWNSTTALTFGTAASTAANNLDLGTGTVTLTGTRAINFLGTGTKLKMADVIGTTGNGITANGAGNTLEMKGLSLSTSATAVNVTLDGSADINVTGAIANGTTPGNGLIVTGTGTKTFSGNNTYTGATDFRNGTNIISGDNSAAVGNVIIAGSTGNKPVVRLDNVNGISSSSSLLGASGNAQAGTLDLRAAGNFSLNSFGLVGTSGNNMIFTNSSGSQKTLAFTAANNYITIAGTGGRTLYNNSANLLLDFDGNIEIGGTSDAAEATTFSGVGNFNVDGNLLDNGTGLTRTLRKQESGTLTLRGSANSIRGSTLVEGGTLDLYGNLTASTDIVVSTSGTSTTGARTVNSTVNVRTGGSLLNSSTTTVWSRGNLIVNGTAGDVVVKNYGLLGGSGTVDAITLESGSFLTPGNSPGTLNATSASLLAGSTYNWEINSAAISASAGMNWDLLNVTTVLDLSTLTTSNKLNLVLKSLDSGGLVTTSLADFTIDDDYTWVFAQAGEINNAAFTNGADVTDYFNINTTAFNDDALDAGYFKVRVGETTVGSSTLMTLQLTNIPEPSTGSMLGLGFAGLVVTRLLRRKIS